MIHITIPDTKLVVDSNSSKFNSFNVCINGAYHTSLRYSQFLRLYEALKREYGSTLSLPEFPPKKFKHNLSEKQLAERKLGLHRFLQAVVQHAVTSKHPLVLKFFLDAQVESFHPTTSNISLDIGQADGVRHGIRCSVDSPTSLVHEIFCHSIGLKNENIQYFGLFLVKRRQKGYSIVRWLRDFESPYISLQLLNQRMGQMHEIMVKKCCWDPAIEQNLSEDSVAINLLFTEAVVDINSKLIPVPADLLQRLRSLQQEKSIKEYVKLCQIQPRYGFINLEQCIAEYPEPDTRADLRVGRRQIVISYSDTSTEEKGYHMVFEFEYLMARDHFEWITVYTDQAVLLSLFLQAMGAEILKDKSIHQTFRSPPLSVSSDPPTPSNRYESLNDVLGTTNNHRPSTSPITNDAFNRITDDDL